MLSASLLVAALAAFSAEALLHRTGAMRNFLEWRLDELRRKPLPRTPVNKPPMVACLEFLVGRSDVLLSYSARNQSRSGDAIRYRNGPMSPWTIPKTSLMKSSCAEAFSSGPA